MHACLREACTYLYLQYEVPHHMAEFYISPTRSRRWETFCEKSEMNNHHAHFKETHRTLERAQHKMEVQISCRCSSSQFRRTAKSERIRRELTPILLQHGLSETIQWNGYQHATLPPSCRPGYNKSQLQGYHSGVSSSPTLD